MMSDSHRCVSHALRLDALDGKIRLIITKSTNRFSRNTADSLYAIRKLKEHNMECFIRTLKSQIGILIKFGERLWSSMVDFVTVGREKEIVVTFRDGTEIEA